ncbi:MAG TPA: hypothetical protein VJV78_08545 [Polyangiales bacterium]|nr:hypothetical protein [Polyangiales bacterium]
MAEESLADRLSRPLPRWAIYAILPGAIAPVLILGFIFVSEIAHDEARCPFRTQSDQQLSDGVHVREDARSCLPGIEERRYSVLRAGAERVLGRRRFARGAFDASRYRWRAELSAQGEVRVTVDNDGHEQAVFREGTAADETR